MTYSINKNNILGSTVFALALLFVMSVMPSISQANTITIGTGSNSKNVTITVNKSNPITLNYSVNKTNSGNISLTINKTTTTPTAPTTLAYDYGCSYGSYGCGNTYYPPVYTPPTYYYPPTVSTVSALQVSCYPMPLSTYVGNSVTWASSVSGGTGSYSYSWSGSNGYMGNSSSVSTVYGSAGTYSAYLTVTSGSQSQSVSCSSSVTVYGNSSTYYNYNNYSYSSLQVSCTPNITSTNVGYTVTWSANAYGGSGYYTYSWSGTDGLYGYNQSIATTYSNPGYKTATVTVTSNGQSVSQTCSNSVNVNGYQTSYNGYNNTNNNNGLNIGCYADPATVGINQPATWAVEVTGGVGPYTYSWSGTDDLNGSGSSIVKYYSTGGQKSAIVSVSSADGKTGTRACSNSLSVRGSGANINNTNNTNNTNNATTTNANQTNGSQSAAALFSLQNVPWGWIAILIILVLFATILYLIFNRPKI